MNLRRITVSLSEAELTALSRMASADCRRTREEARFIIYEAARVRGLLPKADLGNIVVQSTEIGKYEGSDDANE